MRQLIKARALVALAILVRGHPSSAAEPTVPDSSEDAGSLYGDASMISVATRYRQPIHSAPATATVITREDIERLHPRSLAELLNHVAGLHVQPSDDARGTRFVERGRDRNIEFLVDGVPIVRGFIFGWQSLDNVLPYDIERVEILRGPASAVYGADAAGGVINVITRSGLARNEAAGGGMVGSFDTRDVWARVGHEFNDVAFSIYAGRRETDQSEATVSNDAQTTFDQLFHTHASLAPGPLDQQRNVTDVQATARAGPWKLSVGEFAETSFHVGAGLAQALDPTGINNNRLATATLTYSNAWGPLTITGFVGYAHVLYGGHATLYPPGAFGGLFPEGVLFAVTPSEDRWHAELFGVYQTRSAHKIVVGVGYFTDVMPTWMDQRNFIVQGSLLIPTGMFAPGAGVGGPPVVQRTVEAADYIYAEDAWIFAPDWTLTLGGRLDAYSRFGNQFNPRAALVWDETSHMTWKLVYTTAFETPSVSQTSSNGIVYPLGSQSLSPTRDRAVSLSNTLAFGGWRTDITLFGYRDSELIITVPDPASVNGQAFVNGGTAEGWGVEGSVNYTWPNGIRVGLTADTYTLVRQAENTEGLEVGLAARHHIGAIGTVPLPGGFAITANVLSVGDYYRPPDAVRPPPPAYTLFGLSGTWQSSDNHVSITAGARNLFNSLAIEPTASALGPTPGIPLPGRELFLSLTLRQ